MFWALSVHQLGQTFQKLNEIGTFIVTILQMGTGGTRRLNDLPKMTAGKGCYQNLYAQILTLESVFLITELQGLSFCQSPIGRTQ